jgi:hypothetical protein
MPWLVDIVGSLLIGALSVQAQPLPIHYMSPKECAFEFDYPSDWQSSQLMTKHPVVFGFAPVISSTG